MELDKFDLAFYYGMLAGVSNDGFLLVYSANVRWLFVFWSSRI